MLIAVLGASGNLGLPLLSSLALHLSEEKSTWKIRAVSRSPEILKAKLQSDCNFDFVYGDVTNSSIRDSLIGVERVFLCLPQCLSSEEMRIADANFIEVAKEIGVKHVVRISSYGIDNYLQGEGITQGPLGEAHLAGERGIVDAGLTLTSIRPTSFSSNFVKYDLQRVLDEGVFSSPLGTQAAVNWVDCKDIAEVSARALLDPSLDGQVLNVMGPPCSTLTAIQMQAPTQSPRPDPDPLH